MKTFTRLLGFLRPYRRGVGLSLGFAIVAMVLTVSIPWLTGRAIDAVRSDDERQVITLAIVVAVAGVVRWLITVARRLVAGRVSLGVEVDLREALYGHLQRLELGFFDRQQTGQLMSRATVDLQSVRFFLGYGLVFMTQSALTLVLAAVAMLLLDVPLALVALAPVPFVVLVARGYGRRARPAQQEVQQRIAELTAEAEENVSGVRVVKAFAREDRQRERFAGRVDRVFAQAMLATRIQAFYNPLIGFLPQLGLAALLLVGGRRVMSDAMTLGEFTAFYAYLLMLLGPMRTLGVSLGMAQRATASGARIFELLDRAPQLSAPAGAPPLPAGDGLVELRDVTFRYPEASEPALREVSLVVEPGSTLAVVGTTGSGKSSLAKLLPRLYDVEQGAVLLDGADVREVDLVSLRRAIAIVDDDPFLFSATVAENIAYARPDASREEVEAAARRAQAYDFVTALPDGFDTVVGERGLTLSGGQRQRVAVARAFLADPRVLVLDDATSSVDAATEADIKAALGEVMEGRTTIVIAHRRSTIEMADQVVVLDRGRVVARGTPDAVAAQGGLFADILEQGRAERAREFVELEDVRETVGL